ncbi:hypothetical protein G6F46_009038 [Rhizopus delemar]|nr:hypothetical protein G6F52_007270 [Rhizopus delemar]KAG1611721.1 hypothetical protein G6F46_009038 [Rhizopus delemar]
MPTKAELKANLAMNAIKKRKLFNQNITMNEVEIKNIAPPQAQGPDGDGESDHSSQHSLNYHRLRVCDYYFVDGIEGAQQQEETQQQQVRWLVAGINQNVETYDISQRCFRFKENTKKMKDNPANLSDMRLLALNDIYLFKDNIDASLTRYFRLDVHTSILSAWDLKPFLPEPSIKAASWCSQLGIDPPNDFMSCVSRCSGFMTEATISKNVVDTHTAHILSSFLPILIDGSSDKAIEDSYVHHYLSPIIVSIFESDRRLKTRWANGNDIKKHNPVSYKPDFCVYTQTINIKCVILIAEFKPTENNSAVESDEVKLGRQMKAAYNDLVEDRIPNPIVCGMLAQGKRMSNYVMDMISPQLYRFRKFSEVDLCFTLSQLDSLPTIVLRLLQLKNVDLETVIKSETAILSNTENMHIPPKHWLTVDNYLLARKRKK